MQIQENTSLKPYNSFSVAANARYFVAINRKEELSLLFSGKKELHHPLMVLGGGSNVLFTGDFEGTVLKMNLKGIQEEVLNGTVLIHAGAGEVWNDLVMYCVNRGYAGIENLTLIPGLVGAAPIQNIGAYGVELKDVFSSLEAFDLKEGSFRRFSKEDCAFGYRESIFKSRYKGRFIITSVTLRLSLDFQPNSSYGAIEAELARRSIEKPGIGDISEVVAAIRVSKLPDPATIGNAGSFFKNPVLEGDRFAELKRRFPDVVAYPLTSGSVKVAAGWLIEQCGWKGKTLGQVGTWKNQALVLVNQGKATGQEIFDFSEKIIDSVHDKFSVRLEREVNIV